MVRVLFHQIFSSLESANVKFLLIAKYQGKDLNPIVYEATYEIESEDVLSERNRYPVEHIEYSGRTYIQGT